MSASAHVVGCPLWTFLFLPAKRHWVWLRDPLPSNGCACVRRYHESFAADVFAMGLIVWEVFSEGELWANIEGGVHMLRSSVIGGARPPIDVMRKQIIADAIVESGVFPRPKASAASGAGGQTAHIWETIAADLCSWSERMWAEAPAERPKFQEAVQGMSAVRSSTCSTCCSTVRACVWCVIC